MRLNNSLSVFWPFDILLLRISYFNLYLIYNWIVWYFDVRFLEFFVYFDQSSVICVISENLITLCILLFCLTDSILCLTKDVQVQEVQLIN